MPKGKRFVWVRPEMAQFAAKVSVGHVAVARALARETFKLLVDKVPVDRGIARAQFRMSINRTNIGTFKSVLGQKIPSRRGRRSKAFRAASAATSSMAMFDFHVNSPNKGGIVLPPPRTPKLRGLSQGDFISISNNAPHFPALRVGWSSQAKAGWVEGVINSVNERFGRIAVMAVRSEAPGSLFGGVFFPTNPTPDMTFGDF